MIKFVRSLQFFVFCVVLTTNLNAQQTISGSVITPPCNNNGQIGITVTGLTPPITYSLTNYVANLNLVHPNINSLSNVFSNVPAFQNTSWSNANIWTISASDGTSTLTGIVSVQPPFKDSIVVANGACPANGTLSATNFVGGTPPYSVIWTNTLSTISYPTNPAQVPDGNYSVTITDGAGCTVSSVQGFSYNIVVSSTSGIIPNISGTQANCTNGTALTNPSGGTPPYTYLWSNAATSQNISGLTAGSYNCIVTDATGCHSTGYYYVQQAVNVNFNSTVTDATCLQTNGSILGFVTGGVAPYTFLWSNGGNTQNISGLQGGQSYIVQVTDANGCTGIGYSYVNVTTPISVTYSTNPSSCTSATGSATITATGGTPPYTVVWNTFPSPSSGISITNKPSGTYPFTVTDANGCIKTGSAFIPPNSIILASISNNTVICPATTGNLSAIVTGLNGPFTYAWSNSATTSMISGVPLGNYSCVITDALGCLVTKNAVLYQNTPITVGFNSTPASCLYANDGSAAAFAFGGTAPYTYQWSNSQTGATATGLTTGNYYLTVTDANGCQNNSYNSSTFVSYNPSNTNCYCTITGTVFSDANTDCIQNLGEVGIPNIQVHCSGYGYAYTNSFGVYSFKVPTGTYTISETLNPNYPFASCMINNQVVNVVSAANCVSSVNFANIISPVHDLHIITSNMNAPIPGNTYTQKVIVQNEGTLVENTVKLGYKHDGQLAYTSCAPWSLAQQNASSYPNWYSISSGFPTLNPNSSSTSYINYSVPTNIPLNTTVNFNDTVASSAPIGTSWLTDHTPWNNVSSHQAVVIGSYDPNFKEVSPKGTGAPGNISQSDSILTYIVHFQNTGSYFAQNIVVIDSLDSDLNISALRPGYSDHEYTTTMSETGVIKFSFKNINLPWQSAYGDLMSSGMFVYSIKLKSNLPVGTQLKNKAAIYFDYNDPIITNTTLNTIASTIPTSIKEYRSSLTDGLVLFPNPATHAFTLSFESVENTLGELTIIDVSGRAVSHETISVEKGTNLHSNNCSRLQNGIYLVQLKTNTQTITKKLIVSK
jgi:uncharacterized repeat protein (TIGR01451 family)